jgi:hypothetical protein
MNMQVAEQKRPSSNSRATSTEQASENARTRFPNKSLNLLVFLAVILAVGCGGSSKSSSPSPTPPPPTPTESNGHFRALKSVTATQSLSPRALDNSSAPTSSLSYARSWATATLLVDGRVLVAGGSVDAIGTYTAEVFDPATEMFSLLASTMSWGRNGHCAVTLPDNRVVLVGGWAMFWVGTTQNWDLPQTVDIFDPTTNTFSPQVLSGSLPDQGDGGATLCFPLSGNRIFINAAKTGLMVLDTNTWQTRALPWSDGSRAVNSSVTQTPDGQVWFVGGGSPSNCTSTADIVRFDPATESLATVGQLLEARFAAGIITFPDNSVEVYGGASLSPLDGGCFGGGLSSIERIDSAGTASKIGDLPMPMAFQTPVILQNGESLHVGGSGGDGCTSGAQYVFDETTYTAGVTGNMVEDRSQYGITPLTTGRVLIVGGNHCVGTQSNTAEIFEPDASIYVLLPKTAVAPGEFMQLSTDPATSDDVTWTAKYGTITTTGGYTAPSQNPNGVANAVTTLQDEVTAMLLSTGARAQAPITVQFPVSTNP